MLEQTNPLKNNCLEKKRAYTDALVQAKGCVVNRTKCMIIDGDVPARSKKTAP